MKHEEIFANIARTLDPDMLMHQDFPWGGVVMYRDDGGYTVDVYTDKLATLVAIELIRTHSHALVYSKHFACQSAALANYMGVVAACSDPGSTTLKLFKILHNLYLPGYNHELGSW